MRLRVVAVLLYTFIAVAYAPSGDAASPWDDLRTSAVHPETITVAVPYRSAWRSADYVMEFDVHVDDVTLQYRSLGGAVRAVHSGMLVPVADRPIRRAVPAILLPNDVRANSLRLTLTTEVNRPSINVLTLNALSSEDAARRANLDFPLLLFAGLFLALALANLTLFASFRDRAYMWYAGVMVSAAAIALRSSPDIFWAWMFAHVSVRYVVVHDSTILAYSVCLIAFTRTFLSTRRLLPRFDRFLVSMYFVFLAVELSVHYGLSGVHLGGIELVDAVYMVFLLVPFAAGILALRAGSTAAPFYIVAFSGVFISLIVMDVLALFGHTFELIIFIGMAWEGFWLIAALGDRVRRLDRVALDLAQEQAAAALHDALTGLSNRRKMEIDLRQALPPFALLYIDIDHFSVVNATVGHETGDDILMAAAQRLDTFVRSGDTLAHTSSDEFALLLKHRTSYGIAQIAKDVVAAFAREPFLRDHQTFPLTVSVGCLSVTKTSTPSMLLAMADDACACAKEKGRNRVYFADDETAEETTRAAMRWAARVSDALQQDQFVLFYQPIVPLTETKDAPRAEILVRLLDGDGSVVESSRFLPAAERYSLTASVDRWVIRHALPVAAPLLDSGRLSGISINLSGNALQDPHLASFISSEIRASGIRASGITFEITETIVLPMLSQVRMLMSALRRYGVCFSLDDFGTGTSSLGILRQLDVDFLKIDGAFVRECATNAVDAAMLRTIRDLANALGLKTIAEYAKDNATIEKLREIGIDYAQGWAYARPQPLEELAAH